MEVSVKIEEDAYDFSTLVDWTKVLKTTGKIIVDDHFNRLRDGIDVNGEGFTELKPETIAQKRAARRPFPEVPLYATGRMRLLKAKSPKRNKVEILLRRDRDAIGGYHQYGEGKNPVREWVGISDDAFSAIAAAIGSELVSKLEFSVKN